MPLKLKSLELHGYKTFASRTVFEFASAVTAIVGPNGSGKSNIADALRWVLGEQSYSLLRGRKTEDMIFAGSEQRPRAGMASATVVFDNSDGWLPIDYSEVAIARRAYRDGENEYLLNGQRVRLKDVSELLAQSGLAERTYTIIGQGLVDAALALKAEERRRLFEEAAGVGLHRARREEATRRLEATLRNLERIEDILAELQPRLHSLERQARRAQEYEQVKADLRVVLREWYGYHWHRAQAEVTAARKLSRSRETALTKARQEQAACDRELQAARGRIQELRARLNEWHRQLAGLHARREGASRELAVIEERLRSLDEQLRAAQVEQARLEEEISLHQHRLHEATGELQRLEAERGEDQEQAQTAKRALQELQAEREAAGRRLEAARQALAELASRQSELEARLAEREIRRERLQESLAAALQAIDEAEAACRSARKRSKESERALRRAQANRQAAEAALAAHLERLSQAEAQQREALAAQAERQAELARLRAQLEVLDQAEGSLSGYDAGTRLLLQAAREARLEGARGALSGVLEVPAGLEIAIAASLGEFLDALVLDGAAQLDQALAALEGQSARGAILPLDWLEPEEPVEWEAQDGEVLGVASGLVSAPPELAPALRVLLGRTLVVRDRAAARRLLGRMKKKRGARQDGDLRLVTLNGELFHLRGPVVAGQKGDSGALGRLRQRRELGERIRKVERAEAEQSRRVEALQADLAAMRAEGEQLTQALEAARREEQLAGLAHNQDGLALEQAGRQAQWHESQKGEIEAEMAREESLKAQLLSERADLEAQVAAARAEAREKSAALAELALDELQERAAHWEVRAALASKAVEDARARLDERGERLEALRANQQNLAERSVAIEEACRELEQQRAGLRRAEGEIAEQVAAVQAVIEPAELELEASEAGQVQLQAAEALARQALNQAEHQHAQAKIGLARSQEALEALRRRIEDDFGLVAFEYAEEVSGPTPLPLEGMVEQLPQVRQLAPEVEETLKRQRALLRRMGPVNPEAQAEYRNVRERFEFLTAQVADLQRAENDVRQVIAELDDLMEREFRRTFEAVAEEFHNIFARLFGGGSARLVLTDPEDLTLSGIDIEARLPGRREQGLTLLSGGERSLAAAALVFALLKISPTPFCVLDEVDAMLDEANVGRFRELLSELSRSTQFIIITHNRNTVQAADVIYGVTMGRDSASQMVSLKMDELEEVIEA